MSGGIIMYNKVDTNLNFVEREKQIEKFDLYWSKKIKKLPNTTTKTSHCFVEMRGVKYYFNKVQRESEKDYCIVCKKGVAKNNSGEETLSERKVYSKNEFREVFVDYDEFPSIISRFPLAFCAFLLYNDDTLC